MERGQFTFYASFASAISRIKSKAARCDAYDAIVNYAIYGSEPEALPESAAIAFDLIRPILDKGAKRAESGRVGGSKQSSNITEANVKQTESKTEANAKQTAREKEREKEGEEEREKEKENECSLPPIAPRGGAFDKFWAAYPRKVGKEAARRSFQKVKVPVETLLDAIEQQKRSAQWTKDNGQFIPHPATWLNQGRWEDECTPAVKPGGFSMDYGNAEKKLEELRAAAKMLGGTT